MTLGEISKQVAFNNDLTHIIINLIASSLHPVDFRANWKYNHGDEKMQSFLSKVPIYVQWDDHEVTNNWWFGEVLGEPLYANDTLADNLVTVSLQALIEHNPVNEKLMYRTQQFGQHLEIFFPDFRTYRGPNPDNINNSLVDMMGKDQLTWLKEGLSQSTATWKLISAHGVLIMQLDCCHTMLLVVTTPNSSYLFSFALFRSIWHCHRQRPRRLRFLCQ